MHHMMRFGVLAAVLVVATPLQAQTGADEPTSKAFCFRPGRAATCRSFLLFQARVEAPLVRTSRAVHVYGDFVDGDGFREETHDTLYRQELGTTVGWDIGYAVNLNTDWMLGVSYTVDFSHNADRREGTLHVRRWVSDDIAIDVAPGLVMQDIPGSGERPAYNIAARVHAWDFILGLRYDALDVEGDVTVRDRIGGGGTYTTTDPGGIEHLLSASLGMESVGGALISMAVFGLVALAFSGT